MLTIDPENQLPQLIKQVCGAQVEIGLSTVLNQLDDYLVVVLDLLPASTRIVVKLAGPAAQYECPFDRTASILKQVASCTTIQMPDVLAVDVSYRYWPWRYMVKTYLEGEEWATARAKMSPSEQAYAFSQIGHAVGQLHAIRYPSFGELNPDGGIQTGQNLWDALTHRANLLIKSARSRDLFRSILDRDRQLFEGVTRASLCHEDLHRHNILFEHTRAGWQLKTILDFDKAWAGHSESDLARLSLWKGMTSPEFWTAYQSMHPVEEGFLERQVIYQLLWCLEFARMTPEHLADTRRICEASGITFPGEF
jgi:fructosamine-3-kinase